MKHPLEFLPLNLRKPLFFFFLAFALVMYGVFGFLDRRLQTPSAPFGIVSLELAGSPKRAFQILVSWEEACEDCPPIQKFKPLLYAAFGHGGLARWKQKLRLHRPQAFARRRNRFGVDEFRYFKARYDGLLR